MTVYLYEGPAGSGKTTSLIDHVRNHLKSHPLGSGEQVLGLTHMHGARHRLVEKLGAVPELRHSFRCSTFDSFAWRIVNRWRSLEEFITGDTFNQVQGDYDSTCVRAARLLMHDEVRAWVSRTYPLLVVDEAQDCKGGRLEILQQLSESSTLFAAADEFQDLSGQTTNSAVEWLRSSTKPVVLGKIYRTNVEGILVAAHGIRNDEGFIRGRKCELIGAWQSAGAATLIAKRFLWNGTKDVVILTPTKFIRSPFVHDTVDRLQRGPIRSKTLPKPLGPFPISWEPDIDQMAEHLKRSIGIDGSSSTKISITELSLSGTAIGMKELENWINQQRNLRGIHEFSLNELNEQIVDICQHIKSYRRDYINPSIRAMTIHQAKNREFDGVVVLWPFQIQPDAEVKRRLLYNAVTRAKKWCTVVVEDPKETRVNEAPFVSSYERIITSI